MYERAVASFPVTHFLWLQYARYLEAHLKIGSGGLLTRLPAAGFLVFWGPEAMGLTAWLQMSLAICTPNSPSRASPACPAVINAVYARAVRNCPWVGQLWGRALRALERSNAPEEQHAAMYEKALAGGLQVSGGDLSPA